MQEIDPRLRDAGALPRHSSGIAPIAANASMSPGPLLQYPPPHDVSTNENIYTPQSGNVTDHDHDHDGGDGTHDGGPNDPKRPRACEACRGLKVRCEPDPHNPDGPCKRCTKANRNCVVTAPSRKRQKKTDSRVAELEKKIDALTASLQASKSASGSAAHANQNGLDEETLNGQGRPGSYQQVTNGGYMSPFVGRPDARMNASEWTGYPKSPEFDSRKSFAPPMVVAGQKRKHFGSREYSIASESPSSVGGITRKSIDGSSAQHQYGLGNSITEIQKPPQTHEYADMVDKGEISVELATQCFDCYVEKMAPHMPAVVFPPGTTAAEVRKTKPTLFLAIISAASGSQDPNSQRKLTKEVMSIFAERIICNGEKTLELI